MRPAAGDDRIVDPASFEAAFQQHFPPVYRFIARRVGPALAEDLAAETFATAYRRRARFDPARATLRSWLYGIATNLVRNHWRAEQHLLALDARLVPEVDLPGSAEAIDERITAAMLAPRLATGLAQLSRDQRDVLLLSAWAELSHEEIAAVLEIAPGTVRSRLSRARAALREHLGDFDFDRWTFDRPPASRQTRAQIETTAFVTHVEQALSELGHRNLVGYARSVYPPGYSAEPVSTGGLRVFPSTGAGSPWNVRYLVVWAYQRVSRESAFSAAGYRVFDLRFAPAHGTLTTTGVIYRSRTWWRGAIGPVPAQGGAPVPTQCGPGIRLGTGGWPAFIRYELSCGEFIKDGQKRIDGIQAIRLSGNGGRETIWVNPGTYLPVRTVFAGPAGPQLQTDFGWFAPTRARLAELRLPVPPGFRQVSPPGNPAPAR